MMRSPSEQTSDPDGLHDAKCFSTLSFCATQWNFRCCLLSHPVRITIRTITAFSARIVRDCLSVFPQQQYKSIHIADHGKALIGKTCTRSKLTAVIVVKDRCTGPRRPFHPAGRASPS